MSSYVVVCLRSSRVTVYNLWMWWNLPLVLVISPLAVSLLLWLLISIWKAALTLRKKVRERGQRGWGKRKHETQRESEGGRAKERLRRGAVQACLLYLLVTERERKRERAAEGRDNWCAWLSQEEMKRKKLSKESEWVSWGEEGWEGCWLERETERKRGLQWEWERGIDSNTGCVLIWVHLREAVEQTVGEVSLRAKESCMSWLHSHKHTQKHNHTYTFSLSQTHAEYLFALGVHDVSSCMVNAVLKVTGIWHCPSLLGSHAVSFCCLRCWSKEVVGAPLGQKKEEKKKRGTKWCRNRQHWKCLSGERIIDLTTSSHTCMPVQSFSHPLVYISHACILESHFWSTLTHFVVSYLAIISSKGVLSYCVFNLHLELFSCLWNTHPNSTEVTFFL